MGSSAIRSSIVVSIMIEDLRWECYVITSVLLGLIRVVCEARALRWHCNEWDDANNWRIGQLLTSSPWSYIFCRVLGCCERIIPGFCLCTRPPFRVYPSRDTRPCTVVIRTGVCSCPHVSRFPDLRALINNRTGVSEHRSTFPCHSHCSALIISPAIISTGRLSNCVHRTWTPKDFLSLHKVDDNSYFDFQSKLFKMSPLSQTLDWFTASSKLSSHQRQQLVAKLDPSCLYIDFDDNQMC